MVPSGALSNLQGNIDHLHYHTKIILQQPCTEQELVTATRRRLHRLSSTEAALIALAYEAGKEQEGAVALVW
jgi:hypothetical protein